MANISNSYNLSYNLVNERTLANTRDFYNIKLSQKDGWYVIGQMKNPIQFQMNAEYNDLIGTEIPGADLMKKFGNTSLSSGIFSQKYFSNGGHLELALEFRVNEGQYQEGETNLYNQNISKVTEYANRLAQMVATDVGPQDLGSFIGILKDTGEKALNLVTGALDSKKNTFDYTQGKILEAINNRTISVEAGRFLKCDGMVITSLGVTYSKELTKVGPLYADFVVNVQSIQALHKGNTGTFAVGNVLGSRQEVSRVKVISDSQQNNNKS
jgi:hypothetical protein